MTIRFSSRLPSFRRLIKGIIGQRLVDRCAGAVHEFQSTPVFSAVIGFQFFIGRWLPVSWFRCGWKIKREVSLESLRSISPSLGVEIRRIREEESVSLSPPKEARNVELNPVFRDLVSKINPEFSLLDIRDGYAFDDGTDIGILTASGTLITGASTQTSPHGRHPMQLVAKLPRVRHLEGNALFLSTWGATSNYYHWVAELLPKALGITSAGIDLNSFDHIIVNSTGCRFQRETLELLGIPFGKLVSSGNQTTRFLTCDHLHVPTHTCYVFPPRWALDLLRERILPVERVSPKRRIYVSRSDANHRNIVNEKDVEALLERYGFETVRLASLSVQQQAILFSSATAIVSVHGAGLTNLAFANKGCKIIEIFASSYVMPFYWGIATTLGLDYTYLTVASPKNHSQRSVTADLQVNLNDLKSILVAWGC